MTPDFRSLLKLDRLTGDEEWTRSPLDKTKFIVAPLQTTHRQFDPYWDAIVIGFKK